ncbi:hypothetical protein [Novosphingobium sp. PASSN1]|uniref:hypothetical protein n=1 Tax=Novosphingobium sp. PASSN1 TaxID=2015561 RepID=UPI0025EE5620|nr:hypothetical protein [Novosphingobium sp. PASSN1]
MTPTIRSALLFAVLLGAGLAAPLAAQVGTIQQQQLESCFLGDQNSRLVGQHLSGEIYTNRAVAALEAGDFKRSLAILRPYRMTASITDLLISGMAHAGLAEYSAARKDYEGALHKRRNFTAAQIALAELEAGHGDKAVALKLLQDLTARRDACHGTCADAAELGSGIDRINAVLLPVVPAH